MGRDGGHDSERYDTRERKATLTVYGRLPSNYVLGAVYLDTVTVTVNF